MGVAGSLYLTGSGESVGNGPVSRSPDGTRCVLVNVLW